MYYLYLTIMVQTVLAKSLLNKDFVLVNDSEPENELANLIMSKGYIPDDKNMPESAMIMKSHDDEAYLLSKLSDEDLIKLLSEQSNKDAHSLNDLINVAAKEKSKQHNIDQLQNIDAASNFPKVDKKNTNAFFRLNDMEVPPQSQQNNEDFIAWKKLNNLLSVLPQQEKGLDKRKKELIFDMLVAQLKLLCCNKQPNRQELLSNKPINKISSNSRPKNVKENKYNSDMNVPHINSASEKSGEFMFLVINDKLNYDLKSSDEIILVDSNSLEKNSSVLLLGPITTPLSDSQLKTVMNRISDELSKPDYVSLLQQLSDGTLTDKNKNLMVNLVFGPETRRYIKAHRCNHQSKLARIYGGPKWLICTGYLNLNKPSLYD